MGSRTSKDPTAMQEVAVMQDTPLRVAHEPNGHELSCSALAGLRLSTVDQRVPFQSSASKAPCSSACVLSPMASDPTAKHAVADAQDTPENCSEIMRNGGLTGCKSDHVLPFQRSPIGIAE